MKWLLTCLLLVALASGCSPADQNQGPSSTEIRSMIREELRSPEGRELIKEATEREELRPMIRDMLKSPEGQQEMMSSLEEIITAPEMQRQLQTVLEDTMRSPESRQVMAEVVTEELLDIVRRGAGEAG